MMLGLKIAVTTIFNSLIWLAFVLVLHAPLAGAVEPTERALPVRGDQVYIDPFLAPNLDAVPLLGATDASPDGSSMELQLKGILLSAHEPLANVNGRILGVGEQLNGYTVVAISSTSAALEKGGQRLILQLFVDGDPGPATSGAGEQSTAVAIGNQPNTGRGR